MIIITLLTYSIRTITIAFPDRHFSDVVGLIPGSDIILISLIVNLNRMFFLLYNYDRRNAVIWLGSTYLELVSSMPCNKI